MLRERSVVRPFRHRGGLSPAAGLVPAAVLSDVTCFSSDFEHPATATIETEQQCPPDRALHQMDSHESQSDRWRTR